MTISDYIDRITEHSYRVDLLSLLETLLPDPANNFLQKIGVAVNFICAFFIACCYYIHSYSQTYFLYL